MKIHVKGSVGKNIFSFITLWPKIFRPNVQYKNNMTIRITYYKREKRFFYQTSYKLVNFTTSEHF